LHSEGDWCSYSETCLIRESYESVRTQILAERRQFDEKWEARGALLDWIEPFILQDARNNRRAY